MVPSTTVECYASVDCHGHIILSALNKGDCCAAENGRGLSFLRSGACENCFSKFLYCMCCLLICVFDVCICIHAQERY